jgi:hypothetical protein
MNETPGERTRSDEKTEKPRTSPTKASKRAGKKPAATKTAKATKATVRARTRKMMADAEEPPVSKTPATEKPVQLPPPKKTSQYVVTVDNATGLLTKIEKLDADTGDRKELSQAEYLQLGSMYTSPYTNPLTSGFTDVLGTPGATEDLSSAYYRGVMDYLKALNLY